MSARLVRDVMATDVITVDPTTPFREIVARLTTHRVGSVPVVGARGRVLGVVSEADLLLTHDHRRRWWHRWASAIVRPRSGRTAEAKVAGGLMTPAVSVSPTATVAKAARRMLDASAKRLPVVDETGRLVGSVGRADVLNAFIRPDLAIQLEIMEEVIARDFIMNPHRFRVDVDDGVVVIQGRMERRSLIPLLVRAVEDVDGVVRAECRLTFDVDDQTQQDITFTLPRS